MTQPTTRPEHDDEIDLIKLISNLWQEKLTIVICTVLIMSIAIIYALTATPVYQASTQIQAPTTGDLALLNNTQIIEVTPEQTFSTFLKILGSDLHKSKIIETHQSTIKDAFGISNANITSEQIHTIQFPSNKKTEGSLEPDFFTVRTEGINKKAMISLIDNSIKLATQQLVDEWKIEFERIKSAKSMQIKSNFNTLNQNVVDRRDNQIIKLTEENILKTKNVRDQLNGRKNYILNTRQDRVSELKEAIKIAKKLDLKKPSSLSILSKLENNNSTSNQVEVTTEIKDKREPLYLRGTTLLAAELENLEALPNIIFLDPRVRKLETALEILSNNREIEILKSRKNDVPFNDKLQEHQEKLRELEMIEFPIDLSITFQNDKPIALDKAIKPKKPLIVIMAILLGGIIGLFIAIGRIVYKDNKIKTNVA